MEVETIIAILAKVVVLITTDHRKWMMIIIRVAKMLHKVNHHSTDPNILQEAAIKMVVHQQDHPALLKVVAGAASISSIDSNHTLLNLISLTME